MIKTGKLLKDNKGSALIMVFSVVLLLVSFGTITLLAGVSNAQMGARYRNWSQEYYEVDQLTEKYVAQMDSYLNRAENYAREYFANKAYEDATPSEEKIPKQDGLPSDLRFSFDEDLQNLINKYWNDNVKNEDENQNVNNLRDFYDVGFRRLYYYYAINLLNRWSESPSISEKNHNASITVVNVNNNIPMSYSSIKLWEDITDYSKKDEYIRVGIEVTKNDSVTVNSSKRVNAQLTVKLPEYQTVTQIRKIPIKTNPIWTNAITAAGSIYFNNKPTDSTQQVNIYGDLFSADKDARTDEGVIAQRDDYLAETQSNGIISKGAYVNIYGNIYSRGDLHVFGNNGRININPYSNGTKVDLKRSAYSNYNMYLNTFGSEIDDNIIKYKQGTADRIPFFYNDTPGGNVYCNSITIEDCDKGTIEVNGNVMMRDDIENNGTNSNINIRKNLIGISSEISSGGNPNASSSITNNKPLSSNVIIDGNIIIPGQIYVKFDGNNYYQTGISIGSWGKNNEILHNTLAQKLSGEQDSQFNDYKIGEDIFNLFTGTLMEKKNHITNYFNQTSPPLEAPLTVDTSVSVFKKVEGYVLGTVIAKTDATGYANVVQVTNSIQNGTAFYELKATNTLSSIMNAKTIGFGNDVNKDNNKSVLINNFKAYVEKSVITQTTNGITYVSSSDPRTLTLNDKTNYIVYAEDNLTLTLSGSSSGGIIYVAGNLTIDGNNEFIGTIICEGDVTINGHPTIRYSEDEIKNCLLTNSSLKEFFKPGESGQETYVDEASIDGIYKSTTVMKRYIINQWREEQVPVNSTNGAGQ